MITIMLGLLLPALSAGFGVAAFSSPVRSPMSRPLLLLVRLLFLVPTASFPVLIHFIAADGMPFTYCAPALVVFPLSIPAFKWMLEAFAARQETVAGTKTLTATSISRALDRDP